MYKFSLDQDILCENRCKMQKLYSTFIRPNKSVTKKKSKCNVKKLKFSKLYFAIFEKKLILFSVLSVEGSLLIILQLGYSSCLS